MGQIVINVSSLSRNLMSHTSSEKVVHENLVLLTFNFISIWSLLWRPCEASSTGLSNKLEGRRHGRRGRGDLPSLDEIG